MAAEAKQSHVLPVYPILYLAPLLKLNPLSALAVDSKKQIWIATDKGVPVIPIFDHDLNQTGAKWVAAAHMYIDKFDKLIPADAKGSLCVGFSGKFIAPSETLAELVEKHYKANFAPTYYLPTAECAARK